MVSRQQQRSSTRPFWAAAFSVCIAAATLALSGKDAAAGVPAFPAYGSNSASASSWLAGAHAGYNWQSGAAVYGFETDLSATHLNSSMSGGLVDTPPPPPTPNAASTSALIDWYGTVRGRLGVTTGPLLFYGTAGLAYGHVGLSSAFTTTGLSLNSQASATRAGWVAGAGLEYLVRPDLTLNLGYQYVDLGTVSLASSTSLFAVTIGQSASAHAQFQTVMAGFSWRFPQTSSASAPWAGGYAGAQAGGAWGNRTDASYTSSVFISDVRLKRDVALVGRRDDGLGIYRYRYLWSDTVYVGVMAQEVALLHPAAVVRDPLTGALGVDYNRLGLHLMTLPEARSTVEKL
jgi:outer membrane immunogenic protein